MATPRNETKSPSTDVAPQPSHPPANEEPITNKTRTITPEERSMKMAAALTKRELDELDLDMATVCISHLQDERTLVWDHIRRLAQEWHEAKTALEQELHHVKMELIDEKQKRMALSRMLSMAQVTIGASPADHIRSPYPSPAVATTKTDN